MLNDVHVVVCRCCAHDANRHHPNTKVVLHAQPHTGRARQTFVHPVIPLSWPTYLVHVQATMFTVCVMGGDGLLLVYMLLVHMLLVYMLIVATAPSACACTMFL